MKELIFSTILRLLPITLLKKLPHAFLNVFIAPINAKIWFKRTGTILQLEKKKKKKERKILALVGKDTPKLRF